METSPPTPLNPSVPVSSAQQWQQQAEFFSLIGAGVGTLAALVTQQVLVISAAALPLTLAVGLNLSSRKRLQQQLADAHRTQQDLLGIVLQQGQEHLEYQLGLQQYEQRLERLQEQLIVLQNWSTEINQGNKELNDYTRILGTEQKQIEVVVDCLRELETYTQAIQLNPNYAKAYYNRALTHQRLGELEAAVADYSEALRLHPDYARAYHNRGIARAHLGDKQAALADLRAAAKHFFDQGDIPSYQKAKELTKRLHDFQPQSKGSSGGEEDHSPTLDSLF